MNAITPAAWHRMPWHPRARLIAALAAEEARLAQRVAELRIEVDALAEATVHHRELSTHAHAAYARGERDRWVVLGERAYQRDRKRRSRATAKELAS